MLSICIPTYNRPKFLEWSLFRLAMSFRQSEIVISDNASTVPLLAYDAAIDNIAPLREMCERSSRIKWIQQIENIGPFPNMLAAFQAATRKYAVYCADDDYLLPEGIERGIAYLEAHPEVAAYCAPCEIWNEVEQKPFWNAFKVPEPFTVDRTKPAELFNFIISQHVWPEHLIFRTPVPLPPRTRAYWAFADLPDILERGAIHFAAEPFYRNVLVHPVGTRTQLGNEQCLTHFDEYRAGLEVLAYGLFGRQFYETRHRIQEMIQSFICTRMDVARQIYERDGDPANAEMLAKRLVIADPRSDEALAA